MRKERKRNFTQYKVTLLVILVVSSALAALVFFAEPAHGGENFDNPLIAEVTNEAIEGSETTGGDTAGQSGRPDTGQDRRYTDGPKYCYITVAYGEDQPVIHPSNTIKVGPEVCNDIGILIVRRYYESMVETQ